MSEPTNIVQRLRACPLCGGESGYSLSDGSTFRWWGVACKDCGEQIGECRSDQSTKLDAPKPERWAQADLHWNETAAHAQGLRDRIEALEAELAAVVGDVRRYRWLRNRPRGPLNGSEFTEGVCIDVWDSEGAGEQLTGDQADAAIDAAVLAEKGKT